MERTVGTVGSRGPFTVRAVLMVAPPPPKVLHSKGPVLFCSTEEARERDPLGAGGIFWWGFSQQPYCQRAILVSWRHLPLNQVCAHTHNHSIRSGFGNQQFELEPAGHNQQDWGEYWDRFRLVFCCRFFLFVDGGSFAAALS